MKVHLKKIQEQVIVITGASSGIGLTTVRMAAKQGAKVIAASRNEQVLKDICDQITRAGGQAAYVVADVGQLDQVERIAATARERFGGFDTWVNNAGVSIYGKIEDISIEDARRLFDTNFWGVVHGSTVAAKHLRQTGGALINVGSVVSDQPIPLQGIYSASKHAVKGFTDSLRMELEHDRAPVSVTLVKPAAINTPYTQHAKNYMEGDPAFPPPVYAPEVVARTILFCAQNPRRDIIVGGAGKVMSSGGLAPRLTDRLMESEHFFKSQVKQGRSDRPDALHAPVNGGKQHGDYEGHVSRSAVYTEAALRPLVTSALAIGAGLAAGVLLFASGSIQKE
ncbi:MAG TPA: SDR family oxidoreductase [Tepidisphaeraceae bacterium]|nr:SDR family oxidoreductase [Tepidisphaeraceae bacterium]